MLHENITKLDKQIGRITALVLFYIAIIYAVITVIGLLTLKSPLEQIHDPWFSIMEILILIMAPLMVVLMVEVHAYAGKTLSLTALIFMSILACITCSEHFVVLTVSRQIESITGLSWIPLFFSFKWPSVIYALDILAWDFFFSLSMFFAAPVFKGDRLNVSVRILMIVSGVLSFAGLIGPIVGDMQIRNIGIVGYAGVFPFTCLLLSKVFNRA